MGIFSNKTTHYVDTQVQRMVEDELLVSTQERVLSKSLFGDQVPIMDALYDEVFNGQQMRFNNMYRYAKKDGGYHYGLPNVAIRSNEDGIAVAKGIIEAEENTTVTVEYLLYRPLNNFHMGWQHITENLGYDTYTNIIVGLNAGKPSDVYLDRMVAVHRGSSTDAISEYSLGTFEPLASSKITPWRTVWQTVGARDTLNAGLEGRIGADELESVEIHYSWLDANGDRADDVLILDLSSYATDAEYYHAKYRRPDNTIGYWLADPENTTIPGLSGLFNTPDYVTPGEYFPFAILRAGGSDRTLDHFIGSNEYDTTKKLLDYIGLDMAAIGANLREESGLEKAVQIVVMMGVPLTSENPIEIEYLYEYFLDLYNRLPENARGNNTVAPTLLESEYGLSAGKKTKFLAEISDADFMMGIGLESISLKFVAGNIGAVGTHENTTGGNALGSRSWGEKFDLGDTAPIANTYDRIFRKQITSGVYIEIYVTRPEVRYRVYGDLEVIGRFNDDIALIPIERNVAKRIGASKLTTLYQRSLHLVFSSHQTQTIKWYQRGAFGAILTLVAFVWFVYTGDTTALKAAIALGSVTAVVMVIVQLFIQFIIRSFVIQLAFNAVVSVIGLDAAIIVAVAAIVAGATYAIKYGLSSTTAQNLLTAGNGLVRGAMNELNSIMRSLQADMSALNLLQETRWDDLNEIALSLHSRVYIDPWEFLGTEPVFVPGETPDQFLYRSVEVDNVGLTAFELVQNFPEISIRLPTITDTVGEYV